MKKETDKKNENNDNGDGYSDGDILNLYIISTSYVMSLWYFL